MKGQSKGNTDKPIVHLVCQAHIDPVWMWSWQEGAREAISTFHTAANLLEEFPNFVFNHNESLLYEWVEENDLALFRRIQKLVKAGRWNIAGGWYLQPDCNMPSGETMVRVILEGRRYFKEKFGKAPLVAYSFDSFGHPASFPQLLKQAGFEMYIHCRPPAYLLDLPALYQWQGHDGTRVLGLRPDTGWYCTGPELAGVKMPITQARNGVAQSRETGHDCVVLWGLGDHGGGPTREDILELNALIEETNDVEVRHSTPEAYVKRITRQLNLKALPVHTDELQRAFAGCYTSVAPIKRGMRRSENLLNSAERWAAIAWWRTGMPYPAAELRRAWKALLFNTFHDTLCGSLIEHAIPSVMDLFGFATHIAANVIFRSQNALMPATPPQLGTIPLYVFNSHPYPMKVGVGANILLEYRPILKIPTFALFDDKGNPVPCQNGGGAYEQSSTSWQPHIAFVADVPPMSVKRYEVRPHVEPARPEHPVTVVEDERSIVIENRWWRATFSRSPESATLVSLVDRVNDRELLRGAIKMMAMRDTGDAWGGESSADFSTPMGDFTALTPEQVGELWAGEGGATGHALRVLPSMSHPAIEAPAIETNSEPKRRGVAVTVEGLSGWRRSLASIQVTLYADSPYIDIDTRLYWGERRKASKLVIPFDMPNPHVTCEVPYGIAHRTTDGSEHSQNRWVRLDADNYGIGVANNGQYSFAMRDDGTLGLSITRGAVHTRWGDARIEPDEHHTFMDQTQIDTRFRIVAGLSATLADALIPAALELNQPLDVFAVFYPPTPRLSDNAASQSFMRVEPSTVQVGALKKADDENALILRLVESAGQATTAKLLMEDLPRAKRIKFKPFEIKTFKIKRRGRVAMIEECRLSDTY